MPLLSGVVAPGTGLNKGVHRPEEPPTFWLRRLLVAATSDSYRKAFCALLMVLVTLFVLVTTHGPTFQVLCGHDSMSFLAFAWKIQNGIYPNADFHIALGPLNAWIHAAGMWLLGPTASVLPFCNGLVAVVIGLLAWTVAARRLPAALAGVFALTQAVVAMAPHPVGSPWYQATYACYYNRQGYALLATVMLAAFLPPTRHDDRCDGRRDAWTLGGICGALLFMKVTYGLAALGLVALASFTAKRPQPWLLWHGLAAFAVAVLLCLPMIRFDVLAMVRDLQMAAQTKVANPKATITAAKVVGWLANGWVEIACLAAAQAVMRAPLVFRRRRDPASAATAPSWAEFTGVVGMNILLLITDNHGRELSETPLTTSWLFVLTGYALRPQTNGQTETERPWMTNRALAITCVSACCLWAFTFGAGLRCLCWSVWPWPTAWTQQALSESPVFESESLAPLRVYGDSAEDHLPSTYADKVNDGLRLLRQLGGVHRVGAFDFNNPFPFALLWPPPRGDFWTWQYMTTFGQFAHPPPEEAFGNADVLMLPKFAGEAHTYLPMRALYGAYVKEHFAVALESAQWSVLVRRR